MLRKHLEYLEIPTEDASNEIELIKGLDEQGSDQDADDVEVLSPIPVMDVEALDEEEAGGSYSPQLLHDDENEDAIDPEEDKAILERRCIVVLEERGIQDRFKADFS